MTRKGRERFLSALADGHTVKEAARRTGATRQALYAARQADEQFAAAWAEAVEDGTETLEQESRRRALEGVLKPQFYRGRLITDDTGEPVDVREYSDALLMFLLRAKRPSVYRENVKHELEQTRPMRVEVVYVDDGAPGPAAAAPGPAPGQVGS